MNIFYSWQADTPEKIGKQFVRQALDDAVKELAEILELEEAERPVVDQDTLGVMGSPVIVETIFEKIRNAQVVVADLTLTCATKEGKKLVNSNVAYELGYAHGHHGDEVILTIMNTHYGQADDLPFDLKHRRWPVRFDLSPETSKTERRKARESLAKELADILRRYLQGVTPEKKFEPKPSTVNAASYWNEGELLVKYGGSNFQDELLELGYNKDQPLIYLRVWPEKPLEELSGSQLGDNNLSGIDPLMGRYGDYYYLRNQYGAITCSKESTGKLIATTQLFKSGEIWGIDSSLLRHRNDFATYFVPTTVFENGIIRSLNIYLKIAFGRLGYSDLVHFEAGLVNVEGFKLAMPQNYIDNFWGPIFEDISIEATIDRNTPETTNNALMKLFEKVFDSAGMKRPDKYNNFPPSTV